MRKMSRETIFVLLAFCGMAFAQTADNASRGKPSEFKQVAFASLNPSATVKVGESPDWVLTTENAIWVRTIKPFAIQRIDPKTNRIVATIPIPGKACSGLASGFGSIWVPICGDKPALVRVDEATNAISTTLPFGPAGPEGGITTSTDSVWMVTDSQGTLIRIDPANNTVRQTVSIPPGSFNPLFSDGVVWITGFERNVLTAVDAATGKVLESVLVGPKPRFLAAGGGSIWTLNQGDGSVTRVDEKSRRVLATIAVHIPGEGGDIAYAADSVWPTMPTAPLTRVDASTNRVVTQWVGPGGDSLRCGFGSIWLTNNEKGLLLRIPLKDAFAGTVN